MVGIETADMVRASTPAAFRAVSMASEFMTVPSIPMESGAGGLGQIFRQSGQGLRIEPIAVGGHQGLSGELYQNAPKPCHRQTSLSNPLMKTAAEAPPFRFGLI